MTTIGGRGRRKRDALLSGGIPRRPAVDLLLIAADEMIRHVTAAAPDRTMRATPCAEWSVRDVVAHCSGTMKRAVNGRLHRFTPRDNDDDVFERRKWPFSAVIGEFDEYAAPAAAAIGAAGGPLDGIAIGVWVHLGDVRSGLGEDTPYDSPGYVLALDLLQARSRDLDVNLVATTDRHSLTLGAGEATGELDTDRDTLIRLLAGRSPDPERYTLLGADPADLVMFS